VTGGHGDQHGSGVPSGAEGPRFLISAAAAGASVLKMVEVSRHKSVDMLHGYVRRADLFRE
jgi:hypothetical protein